MSLTQRIFRWPAIVTTSMQFLAVMPAGCQAEPAAGKPSPEPAPARVGVSAERVAARAPLVLTAPPASAPPTVPVAEQRAFMTKSAKTAWNFVSRARSNVGFVGATDAYPFMTVWDMASTLAATYSARELGFITPAQYQKAMDRAFTTMEKMALFESAAYNKLYNAQTGDMVDRKTARSATGYGWSVLDHGRFLVWLKIVGNSDPALGARAKAIVSRLNMDRIVSDGYVRGQDIDPATGKKRLYQEGRIGYEQYAAEGFALWGARAEKSLDFAANGNPVTVAGQTVLADTRGNDLLTSEPFIMMGLELGWTGPHWRPLSLSMLAAQEQRYKQTGMVTMVSEDAVPEPPAYFYYYLLYHDGKAWVVTTPTGDVGSGYPRWVSAKAAFGYHALAPSDYTWRALQAVKYGGATARGWTAGVYEGTKNPTKSFNVNTAAIVLESALVFQRGGCPLIQRTCNAKPATGAAP
jgi:hypothetical protein